MQFVRKLKVVINIKTASWKNNKDEKKHTIPNFFKPLKDKGLECFLTKKMLFLSKKQIKIEQKTSQSKKKPQKKSAFQCRNADFLGFNDVLSKDLLYLCREVLCSQRQDKRSRKLLTESALNRTPQR